ncbi:MAG: C4-dicarboxylate ABC transporter substrate-binding protein [Pirellulaceae bacterium]|jgi:putative tricarboxylic transport membrane protein|nr:MAG: C4-dicarboxylate ABC transporter substrate-binding protein [Pirellulaceae bacterium]
MRRFFPTLILIAVLLSACANQTSTTTVQFPTQQINIMAPASPGGGWDSTARAMQTALAATTGQTVQVYNVSGAGGTIGLAQFVNEAKGKPHELMVGGLVMVGAIQTNKAPVNLSQVTPLALLTAEAEAIVVPADSKYQTLQELIADFKANPTAISWGGGSAGGTDHILVGLIAKAVGVAPNQINYIAYSGGGEATAAILSGAVTAGVSGVSEFAEQVAAGTMRMLAVSSEQRIAGLDVPTLKEAGVDVALMNWRAVFGAPELTSAQRAAIIAALEKMHASKEWQDALKNNGWTDFFRTGDEFSAFLNNEITRIGAVLRDLGLVQ